MEFPDCLGDVESELLEVDRALARLERRKFGLLQQRELILQAGIDSSDYLALVEMHLRNMLATVEGLDEDDIKQVQEAVVQDKTNEIRATKVKEFEKPIKKTITWKKNLAAEGPMNNDGQCTDDIAKLLGPPDKIIIPSDHLDEKDTANVYSNEDKVEVERARRWAKALRLRSMMTDDQNDSRINNMMILQQILAKEAAQVRRKGINRRDLNRRQYYRRKLGIDQSLPTQSFSDSEESHPYDFIQLMKGKAVLDKDTFPNMDLPTKQQRN